MPRFSRWFAARSLAAFALLAGIAATASAQAVMDEWTAVKPPAPPALSRITVDPATTALLVLDIAKQTCPEGRARCMAMLPRVAKIMEFARARKVTVIYTLGAASSTADIWPEAAMQGGEPVFKSGPDKFINTELEKTLREKGIKTVICIGSSAHGAVLHTAASAAFRGFDVVVPVDLMASETAYPEQYTAWHLVNAPRLAERVKLTRLDWLN